MRTSKLVAFTVLLAAASASSASAQNNKVVRTTNFYEDRASGQNNSFGIILTFTQTPSDKYLNITDVDCYSISSSANPLIYAFLNIGTSSGQTDTGRDFNVAGNAHTVEGVASSYTNITNKVSIKIGPGRFPSILMTAKSNSTGIFAKCVIVGNLSDD